VTNSIQPLDFDGARLKHFRFKSKLRAVLYGSDQDRTTLLDPHACSLGQWITTELLPALGGHPLARAIDQLHFDLHEQARQVIQLLNNGKEEEAHKRLPTVDQDGERLLELLTELEQVTQTARQN
jgi:hypothetical protein